MRRREFITLLGGAAAWVSPARAQEPRRVIGVLDSGSSGTFPGLLASIVKGLKDTGFIEGKNISIEWRWAVGLVDSLSRPKGNLTGMSGFLSIVGPKHVELLHELLPAANRIAFLVNPGNVNMKIDEPEIRAAADRLKQHLEVLTAITERDLEAAFATMVQRGVGGLIVKPDPFFIDRRERLVGLAARHAMPAIYPLRAFADVGGLMSYGGISLEIYQQIGIYVGKILKGTKLADLPVQQSTKLELVINLKTAKALGLTIPPTLLIRADEVIE